MLPLLYTREFILTRWQKARTPTAQNMIYSAGKTLYAVRRLVSTPFPERRSMLTFSCDLTHGARQQSIFLGLMETSLLHVVPHSPGLGVALDLTTGLVTDLVNDQGVLGYLERPLTPGAPVRLTIEVEIIDRVYLPRLTVDGEVILHPALYLDAQDHLSALVGTSLHPVGDARFENPHLAVSEECGAELLAAG